MFEYLHFFHCLSNFKLYHEVFYKSYYAIDGKMIYEMNVVFLLEKPFKKNIKIIINNVNNSKYNLLNSQLIIFIKTKEY